MSTFENKLEKRRREFGEIFIFSVLGIFFYYIFISLALEFNGLHFENGVSFATLIILFTSTAYFAYVISKSQYSFELKCKIGLHILFYILFYISILLAPRTKTIFLFYIPLVLMILMITSVYKALLFSILFIIISFLTPPLSALLQISHTTETAAFNKDLIRYIDYSIVLFSAYLSLFILYYYNQFNKIKLHHYQHGEMNTMEKDNYNTSKPLVEFSEKEKLKVIYDKIIASLENKKLYRDPEFNIAKLSKELNTNISYISKSINKIGEKKFITLISEYRIGQVTEEIRNNVQNKYTLEHIYNAAGFKQQSTFNRIFKKHTGVTPSKFIEELKDMQKQVS